MSIVRDIAFKNIIIIRKARAILSSDKIKILDEIKFYQSLLLDVNGAFIKTNNHINQTSDYTNLYKVYNYLYKLFNDISIIRTKLLNMYEQLRKVDALIFCAENDIHKACKLYIDVRNSGV
jgi:hypothetical protein